MVCLTHATDNAHRHKDTLTHESKPKTKSKYKQTFAQKPQHPNPGAILMVFLKEIALNF